jgi:hypothetical protein
MNTTANGGPPRFVLSVLVFFLAWASVAPAGAVDNREAMNADAELPRVHGLNVRSPEISGIDASTGTCYRADKDAETCLIEWSYLYVTAGAGQYMVEMKIAIDGRLRAYSQGFFQDYLYIPSDMYEPGLEVPCGPPGAGGVPNLGNLYSFVITARDTSGGTTTSSGTLHCPYSTFPIFSDGFESGTTSAWR